MSESAHGAGRRALAIAGRWLLALLPGLLLGAYVRWPGLANLPYFALVPWLILYTDDRRPRTSLAYYFVSAYVAWVLMYPPLYRFGWYVPLAMGLVLFVPMLPFAPVLRRVHHRFRWPRTWSVAVLWTAAEWFRVTYTLSHMDLYGLGYSQARFPILIQIADLVGVHGVTFLVAAANGWLADAWFALRDAGWSPSGLLRERRLWRSAAVLAGLFGLAAGYGAYRLATVTEVEGPRLAIVQPNIGHTPHNAVRVHLSQVLQTEREVEPGSVDLIVWPENAILDDLRRDDRYLDDLAWLVGRKGVPLLLGALDRSPHNRGHTTNTAFLVDTDGSVIGEYDKQVLYPWSEYVPFDDLLARFAPPVQRMHRMLVRMGWGYVPFGDAGDRMEVFSLPWQGGSLPFAVLICFENAYAPVPVEGARLGARMFVHITSEGTVGGPIQEQLLRICLLRAVESRLPYVRAGNTGISGFIDARGKVRSLLRGPGGRTINTEGVLVDTVWLSDGRPTVYSRSRDAFVKLLVALSVVLFVWSYLPRRRREAPVAGPGA